MGSYVGQLQIGNDSNNRMAFGDTLFGTCTSEATAATKIVSIADLDRVMNGIQIRVRFANGNTVNTNVQLQINTGNPVSTYAVTGDCTCDANDVVTFTWEQGSSTSYWRVTGCTLTKTVKDYISSVASGAISGIDSMVFKGTIGTSGATVSALPTTGYIEGWTYKAITNDPTNNFGLSTTTGTGQGKVEPGDLIIAIARASSGQSTFQQNHWTVVQTNIDGAVTGPASSTANHIATFVGTSGDVIQDSGFTIGTSVPANAVFTDENTSYQYSLANNTAVAVYNGCSTADSGGTVLVSVENGVLQLAQGITFTTANAMPSTMTLSESAVAGPALTPGT